MSTHQVDHPLEQVQLIAHTATDDHALPGLRAKGSGDDRLYVVAAVETEQTELGPDALFDEPGTSFLDTVCYRLGIPRPGHPIRIEPDHEYTESEGRCVHR